MVKENSKKTVKRRVIKKPVKTPPKKKTAKKPQKKGKGGRPTISIDWEEFEKLCYMQCTKEEICSWFKVSDSTMTRAVKRQYKTNYEDLYKKESAAGRISLRRAQIQAAEGGNVTMQIWLGKQLLGQRQDVKPTSSNKGAIIEAIEKMAGIK